MDPESKVKRPISRLFVTITLMAEIHNEKNMEIFSYKLIIRSRFHFIRWLTCNLFGLINRRRTGDLAEIRTEAATTVCGICLFFIGLEIAVNAAIICA